MAITSGYFLLALYALSSVLTTVPDGSWCISRDLARWWSGRVGFSMDGEGRSGQECELAACG